MGNVDNSYEISQRLPKNYSWTFLFHRSFPSHGSCLLLSVQAHCCRVCNRPPLPSTAYASSAPNTGVSTPSAVSMEQSLSSAQNVFLITNSSHRSEVEQKYKFSTLLNFQSIKGTIIHPTA